MGVPRTKIVVTLGPATDSPVMITKLVAAGARVFRLNFSFRDHDYHKEIIKRIRSVEKKTKHILTILADLQGPKIRLGSLPAAGLQLMAKKTIDVVAGEPARDGVLPIKYPKLLREVMVGERLLLDDGKIELKVVEKKKDRLIARVVFGGTVTTGKGVGLPDTKLSVQSITDKDIADAKFAERHGADYIVASFVKRKNDILALKKHLKKTARVMVKVEKREAVENIKDILTVVDAVMLGRGDLGLELRAGEMTLAQKKIIRAARDVGRPVIVATQMLESMIHNPRPTRAEITDVANAVIDHADAVMLSAETSIGEFPLEAVRVMSEIIADTEKSAFDNLPLFSEESAHRTSESEHLGKLCAVFARHEKVKGILFATPDVAMMSAVVRHRPEVALVAATVDRPFVQAMNLFWGIVPVEVKTNAVTEAINRGKKEKWWRKGDCVVVLLPHGDFTVLPIK